MRSEGLGWKCEWINDWGGGGGVFMEEVYRSSKWWELKDWGEIVSELMIGVESGSLYGGGL